MNQFVIVRWDTVLVSDSKQIKGLKSGGSHWKDHSETKTHENGRIHKRRRQPEADHDPTISGVPGKHNSGVLGKHNFLFI